MLQGNPSQEGASCPRSEDKDERQDQEGTKAHRSKQEEVIISGNAQTKTACDRTVPQRNLWERMRTEITLFLRYGREHAELKIGGLKHG